MNALLTQQKQTRRSRLPLSQLIHGWAQVALFGWMICWGNQPLHLRHNYSPELEYIAAGSGLDRLCDSTAPSDSEGVSRAGASESNAFGQLVKDVRTGTGAFTWSAVYDGLGRRLQTTQGALTVQSSYDPEVEFLELVTTVNGVRNWHVTGPDLDGRYGGLNGCGGVEAIYNQSTSSATYLLSDTYGHTEGTLSGTTFVWNPTQCDGYGALPGTTKPSALVAGANVASQLGWRGHYIDPTGFYYMGARNYAPDSGTFLSPDPLGHSASMDLYSYCNGDPVNNFDPDGRDIIALTDTTAVSLFGLWARGHSASLIQNQQGGWTYLAKNGGIFGISGLSKNPSNVDYPSLAAFYSSANAKRYNSSVLISTTPQQDAAATTAVNQSVSSSYWLIGSSCLTATRAGLQAAGVDVSGLADVVPNNFNSDLISTGTGQSFSPSTVYTTLNNTPVNQSGNLIANNTTLNPNSGGATPTATTFNGITYSGTFATMYNTASLSGSSFSAGSLISSSGNTSQNNNPGINVASPSGDPLSSQKASWK